MTSRELALRKAIMETFAATGAPPPVVHDEPLLRSLAAQHVVVLDEQDGQPHIRMAHPFAGHRDGARVDAGGRSWWGSCAWDALGIVAALNLREARVASNGHEIRVRDGKVIDDALFHVAVPAREWWADIGFAWATMLLFRSEDDIEEWCNSNSRPRGAVLPVDLLQHLAQRWYGDRLDPAWRPRSREQSQAILESIGLSGPFWRLP